MRVKIWWFGQNDSPHRWVLWRNYWERIALGNAFSSHGFEIVDQKPDIDILMYGKDHINELTAPKRFAWIEDHGARAMLEDWSNFNHVWINSIPFHRQFREVCPHSSVLFGFPTCEVYIPRTETPEYDIVFLGGDSPNRIDFFNHLWPKYKLGVAGSLVDYLPRGKFGNEGEHIDNNKLGSFFNKGHLLPYVCGTPSYSEDGFVSSSVYDATVTSDCLVIHEEAAGLRDVFSVMPIFRSQDALFELIDYYLGKQKEAEEIVKITRKEALEHTASKMVEHMMEAF